MQDGSEDRPLDRQGEGAAGEQLVDHRPAAGLLPQPTEHQGRAEPACPQPRLVLGVSLPRLSGRPNKVGTTSIGRK
jgi:hypothetical protein